MSGRAYLIVDDNEAYADNLAEILADAGDEAIIATSSVRALKLARERRFDAIISDMRMPVMGGAELLSEIRRTDPGLPAVFVTAYTDASHLEAARRQGLLAILPKPYSVERLLEIVASARRDALVAIIDDDTLLAEALCEALRLRGFSAVTATTVIEAERLAEVRPFAALVDLCLPGSPDGEALRRVTERFPAMPVVIITGHVDRVSGSEHPIFEKPFDLEALLTTVERLYGVSAHDSHLSQ